MRGRRFINFLGKGVVIPSWVLAGASVDLNFAGGLYYAGGVLANPTSQLAVSRASNGYAQTVAGVLAPFTNNVLRVTDQGLLIEEARTNLVLQSQNLAAAGWSTSGFATATANNPGAPDGTSTLNVLTEDTTTLGHGSFQTSGVTVAAGATGTLSAYLKAGTRRFIVLEINSTTLNYSGAVIDTQLWTITPYNAGTGVLPTVTLVQLGTTGIYRATVTGSVAAVTTYFPAVGGTTSAVGANGFNNTYVGDGSTIIVWGLQYEAAAFALSYIPTTTTSATRAADAVTASGSLAAVGTPSVGSLFAYTAAMPSIAGIPEMFDQGGFSIRPLMVDTDTTVRARNGTNVIATLGSGSFSTTPVKSAAGYNGTGVSVVGNNGVVASGNVSAFGSAPLRIGSNSGGSYINTYLMRLAAWNSRLPDATLKGFTV